MREIFLEYNFISSYFKIKRMGSNRQSSSILKIMQPVYQGGEHIRATTMQISVEMAKENHVTTLEN